MTTDADTDAVIARLAELLSSGPSDERIAEINRKFDYKYFGDYEMSEDQRQAASECQAAMNVLGEVRKVLAEAAPAAPCGTNPEGEDNSLASFIGDAVPAQQGGAQ